MASVASQLIEEVIVCAQIESRCVRDICKHYFVNNLHSFVICGLHFFLSEWGQIMDCSKNTDEV